MKILIASIYLSLGSLFSCQQKESSSLSRWKSFPPSLSTPMFNGWTYVPLQNIRKRTFRAASTSTCWARSFRQSPIPSCRKKSPWQSIAAAVSAARKPLHCSAKKAIWSMNSTKGLRDGKRQGTKKSRKQLSQFLAAFL